MIAVEGCGVTPVGGRPSKQPGFSIPDCGILPSKDPLRRGRN
jgi:hypothetical protein